MADTLKILQVEDNPGDARLTAEALSEEPEIPYDLRTAETLTDAIEMCREEAPTIILLDFSLPDGRGIELLERLIGEGISAPIVVLTGNHDSEVGLRALGTGAQDYLAKEDATSRILWRVIRYSIERGEAQRELQDNRRLLEESLLQSGTTGWTLDLQTGETATVAWNPRFGPETSFFDVLQRTVPEYRTVALNLTAAVQRGEAVGPVELAFEREDGSRRWLDIRAWPIADGTGRVTRVSGTSLDITERKAREQEQSEQARLRALGTMASGIAHDFNNALAPIMAFAELLQKDERTRNDRSKTDEYLAYILTASKEAAGVVSRMREFYRLPDSHAPKYVINVEQLVRQALNITAPAWKDQALARGITVNVVSDVDDTLPCLTGNANDLQSALTNLTVNAVDALNKDGTITLFCHAAGDFIELGVQDTGKGMTKEEQQRALEPFFTTKGEHGTGLGLSMVYGAVQRHNGTLLIDSTPGVGTTVTMRLPVTSDPEDVPIAAAIRSNASRSNGLRVLVTDDEVAIRSMLAGLLEADGHQVDLAEHGLQALDKLKTNSYDLLMTDKSMPTMNGEQLAAAVRDAGYTLPIIMLTGFAELMAAAGESVPGVDVTLAKPVTWDALRDAIQQVMRVPQAK